MQLSPCVLDTGAPVAASEDLANAIQEAGKAIPRSKPRVNSVTL